MIEKLEYYRTANTDRDGCAREWTSHPSLEDIIDKINEIIEYLNRGEEDEID